MGLHRSIGTITAACVLAAVTLLCGCAPSAPTNTQPPAPESSTPAPPPPPTAEELRLDEATAWVDGASTRELVGSVIMASFASTDGSAIHDLMAASGLGGFILMGPNIPASPDELAALTSAMTVDSHLPPLVAIDEEGGLVTRLPWDTFAGADTLRGLPAADTSQAFAGRAGLLASAGVTVNFGVVADVTSDPASFIYWRSFGDTAAAASERVAAAVTAEGTDESLTVASTLKHFPGHGAAPGDSHSMIPSTEMSLEEWRQSEAPPFSAGIDAGAELLMFGHLSYTAVTATPASLAPEWYSIARDELGFTGVTVTDDLGMLQDSGLPEYQDPVANVVSALTAGADLALIVRGIDAPGIIALVDGVTAAAESGIIPTARLREAAIRTTELRLHLVQ